MNIGDYVCVHSSFLGKFHLPCHIIGDFGGCYQLYCSKGILNTAYSRQELTPLHSHSIISLEKWCQADKVSLRSLASDTSIVEPCGCCLPQLPDSILIDSDSEGEYTDSIWIGGVLYSLFYKDWEVVLSPNGWLTDNIIMAAQKIAIQHYPNMQGLQPVSLQKVNAFGVHTEEFVQIINIRNCHWCVVSTVGCDKGVVNVFDSLYPSVSDSTMNVIARLMYILESGLEVRMTDVEQQLNSSDCGVLAIAYVLM